MLQNHSGFGRPKQNAEASFLGSCHQGSSLLCWATSPEKEKGPCLTQLLRTPHRVQKNSAASFFLPWLEAVGLLTLLRLTLPGQKQEGSKNE